MQVVIQARDRFGNVTPLPELQWVVLDTAVATVSATGVVRAARSGQTRMLVTAAGLQLSVPVTVSPFRSVTSGGLHACGLIASGKAYCWGQGAPGVLGNGTTLNSEFPVPVASGQLRFRMIDAGNWHTCGIALDARYNRAKPAQHAEQQPLQPDLHLRLRRGRRSHPLTFPAPAW
ncbi:MAG: hypothetical protein ACRENP_26865 [Longimicrobiales bacterium]